MKTMSVKLISLSILSLLVGCAGRYTARNDESFANGGPTSKPYPVVETGDTVITPPAGVHPFYKKYINANGVIIVGSEKVRDASLIAARKTVLHLTSKRPDLIDGMMWNNPRISVMAFTETASDLPDYEPEYDGEWGLGQMPGDPTALVSEKGVRYKGNPEYIADFMMHEFVHMIHNLAMPKLEPEAMNQIYAAYIRAVEKGLFMEPSRIPSPDADPADDSGDDEYFTHSVNAYYNLNESLPGPWMEVQIGEWGRRSGTRDELRRNDPVMYKLIERLFPKSRIEL